VFPLPHASTPEPGLAPGSFFCAAAGRALAAMRDSAGCKRRPGAQAPPVPVIDGLLPAGFRHPSMVESCPAE